MAVITIARQYGAGGEAVGQLVARRLKAELLDKEIIAEVARRLQLSPEEVEAQDESPGSFLGRLLTTLGSASLDYSIPPEVAAWTPPYADPAFDPRRAILNITQEVIREAARTGNAVIVGRGGAFVLQGYPGVLHVFLIGSREARIQALAENFGMSEEEAVHRMKQTDANRSAYIRQIYNHDWSHPAHYDMT
ncbi:MAG TPA: cytidylate kinase-like family protein, partial [Candidatus Acidoferrum sp.]|nr:cytidylate kinase-like family protein [Candidatus Acidoferrum sp.]